MEWIIKIGGSLFPYHALELAKAIKGQPVTLICGGGSLANQIRAYDSDVEFSSSATHWASIKCMDILGILLSDKIEGFKLASSISDIIELEKRGYNSVFICEQFLKESDQLEHSWKVTSDSIALYLAQQLEAKLLIATDVDGIYTRDPSHHGAQLLRNINPRKLLDFGETSVDENFAELLLKKPSECYIVNGKYPERVLAILGGKKSISTFIGGDLDG